MEKLDTAKVAALWAAEQAENAEKRLVVFADYGLDDACATAYLLGHREAYEKIDIVPIGGNVPAAVAYCNACKLLTAAKRDGLSLDGVRLVDASACPQTDCVLPHVHGNDGMGDLFPDAPSPVPAVLFAPWLHEIGAGYRVLSLGPCTVPVHMLHNAAHLPSGRTVIMGGCVAEEPNFGAYEFNDGLDHEAFVALLAAPHVAVTLDTCRTPAFNMISEHRTGGRLLDTLINRSVELAAARHNDRCYIYDYIAVRALLHPEEFTTEDIAWQGVTMTQAKKK